MSAFFYRPEHKHPKQLTENYVHKFMQLSSVKLHYVEAGPEDAPVMLMIHGFPEFWYSWRAQIEHFSRDYRRVLRYDFSKFETAPICRVIAVDMRGYGQSEKVAGIDNYTMPILVNDMKELIEGLGEWCVTFFL